MNIKCTCHSTPYLLVLALVLMFSGGYSVYVLTHYGWIDCKYTHELFRQSIISIINTVITLILLFYIIFMPDIRNNNTARSAGYAFLILYLIQSSITVLNTYLFFAGFYNCRDYVKTCSLEYYVAIYVNTILGVLPHYLITLYMICHVLYNVCAITSRQITDSARHRRESSVFIRPPSIDLEEAGFVNPAYRPYSAVQRYPGLEFNDNDTIPFINYTLDSSSSSSSSSNE